MDPPNPKRQRTAHNPSHHPAVSSTASAQSAKVTESSKNPKVVNLSADEENTIKSLNSLINNFLKNYATAAKGSDHSIPSVKPENLVKSASGQHAVKTGLASVEMYLDSVTASVLRETGLGKIIRDIAVKPNNYYVPEDIRTKAHDLLAKLKNCVGMGKSSTTSTNKGQSDSVPISSTSTGLALVTAGRGKAKGSSLSNIVPKANSTTALAVSNSAIAALADSSLNDGFMASGRSSRQTQPNSFGNRNNTANNFNSSTRQRFPQSQIALKNDPLNREHYRNLLRESGLKEDDVVSCESSLFAQVNLEKMNNKQALQLYQRLYRNAKGHLSATNAEKKRKVLQMLDDGQLAAHHLAWLPDRIFRSLEEQAETVELERREAEKELDADENLIKTDEVFCKNCGKNGNQVYKKEIETVGYHRGGETSVQYKCRACGNNDKEGFV